MVVMLTGATGYLGGRLLTRLKKESHMVFCVVRKSSNTESITQLADGVFSYDEFQDLYQIMKIVSPELIIHVAGVFFNDHQEDTIEELLNGNIMFSTILLDAANRAGCNKIINTGTCWQRFLKECYNPINLYAATKQAFEAILEYYVRACGWKAITLELFDVYGPNDTRKKVLNILRDLKEGESIGMTEGLQKMYLCHVEDVVEAYLCAMRLIERQEKATSRNFAVRDEKPLSLREIVLEYLRIADKNIAIHWGERPYREREFMDPEGVGMVLPGWKPQIRLSEGLKGYVDSTEEMRK